MWLRPAWENLTINNMKRCYLLLLAGFASQILALAQSPAQQYVNQKMIGKGPLEGTVLSLMVRDAGGNTVACNEDTRLAPASNTKLVTTGCALHAFGADYRFRTGLGYTGRICDGTLEGDLYIIGGGDPTIGSADSIAYKADALFWKWKTLLRQAGIERIHGRIIGDGTALEGHLEHPSWGYDDMGT